MSSPFLPYHNATLSIEVKGTDLVEDELGNWILPSLGTQEFKVFLKSPSKDDYNYISRQGVDQGAVELEGYLVEPMFFPDSIRLPGKFSCVMKNASTGADVSGVLHLEYLPGSAVGADAITGQPVKGYFLVK